MPADTRRALDDRATPSTRRTAVGRLCAAIGRVLRLLLASLVVSILIEWIGMHLWWPELGIEHSRSMVRIESAFLDQTLADGWAQGDGVSAVIRSASGVFTTVRRSALAVTAAAWWRRAGRELRAVAAWSGVQHTLVPYLRAAQNITQLYAIRLTMLCLAAPLIGLFLWVGLVDGLVQRDLRRWGGGRESAFVYHYAKRTNLLLIAVSVVVYLAMPVSVHPVLILGPGAALSGVSVAITASRFKKYL